MSKRIRSEDKAADALIAKLQKREDQERREHRQLLANSFGHALQYLTDEEMRAVEELLYRAIGRAEVEARFNKA
jgi:hypothetical protein